MAALVMPDANDFTAAGAYLDDVARPWEMVDIAMRRSNVLSLFNVMYVNIQERKVQEYGLKQAFLWLLFSLGGYVRSDRDGSRDVDCHLHRLVV